MLLLLLLLRVLLLLLLVLLLLLLVLLLLLLLLLWPITPTCFIHAVDAFAFTHEGSGAEWTTFSLMPIAATTETGAIESTF